MSEELSLFDNLSAEGLRKESKLLEGLFYNPVDLDKVKSLIKIIKQHNKVGFTSVVLFEAARDFDGILWLPDQIKEALERRGFEVLTVFYVKSYRMKVPKVVERYAINWSGEKIKLNCKSVFLTKEEAEVYAKSIEDEVRELNNNRIESQKMVASYHKDAQDYKNKSGCLPFLLISGIAGLLFYLL